MAILKSAPYGRFQFVHAYGEAMIAGLPENDPHREDLFTRVVMKLPETGGITVDLLAAMLAGRDLENQQALLRTMMLSDARAIFSIPTPVREIIFAVLDGTSYDVTTPYVTWHMAQPGVTYDVVPVTEVLVERKAEPAPIPRSVCDLPIMKGGAAYAQPGRIYEIGSQDAVQLVGRTLRDDVAATDIKVVNVPDALATPVDTKPLLPPDPTFCIVQDWVLRLPGRAQGGLIVATRGCDLTPKFPLDGVERVLVSRIRGMVMNHVDPREIDAEPGCFMTTGGAPKFKISALGHYPNHWVMHVMHAVEIIGYLHPDPAVAFDWLCLYKEFCHSLHVNPETLEEMLDRLCEDRIKKGTIVS